MTITAKILADSVNPNGVRVTTMEVEFPRFILPEFNTHRMFSRNFASSRAIPVSKVIEQVKNKPAEPIHWGKNQAGMQAKEELQGITKIAVRDSWLVAAQETASRATVLSQAGLHKQVVNRLLEPFQTIKGVVTATEWNNFWYLRDHADAQPEIQKLARVMKGEYDYSKPLHLQYGMWHLPYVITELWQYDDGSYEQKYFDERRKEITVDQAIKISCSSCAQVSYRKLDTSLEKAEDIYKKLVESEPVHASAFEHVALCQEDVYNKDWIHTEGWTHRDLQNQIWSANFRDWIQYRQLIPNNSKKG